MTPTQSLIVYRFLFADQMHFILLQNNKFALYLRDRTNDQTAGGKKKSAL